MASRSVIVQRRDGEVYGPNPWANGSAAACEEPPRERRARREIPPP